jgi:hypothetical protein
MRSSNLAYGINIGAICHKMLMIVSYERKMFLSLLF